MMIRELEPGDTDKLGQIWLDASIAAHNFISENYWHSKLDEIKDVYIPSSQTYVAVNDIQPLGFI